MYFMKVLYAEHLKSKRTILKKIPFVLAFVIVGFILFVFRSSDKNEIVMNSGNYWITISAMIAPILIGILVEATTIEAQTRQVCENLKAVVEAAGTSLDKAVKTVCFLADIADFAKFNAVYGTYFTAKPARSCVAVKDLPKGVLCEVEVIAEL